MISFDNYLRRGFSIKLASPKVTMWVGENYTNDLKQRFENKARRIRRKARFNYTFDKEVFDGYYYFYLRPFQMHPDEIVLLIAFLIWIMVRFLYSCTPRNSIVLDIITKIEDMHYIVLVL